MSTLEGNGGSISNSSLAWAGNCTQPPLRVQCHFSDWRAIWSKFITTFPAFEMACGRPYLFEIPTHDVQGCRFKLSLMRLSSVVALADIYAQLPWRLKNSVCH